MPLAVRLPRQTSDPAGNSRAGQVDIVDKPITRNEDALYTGKLASLTRLSRFPCATLAHQPSGSHACGETERLGARACRDELPPCQQRPRC